MTEPEKELYAELMLKLMHFTVGTSKPNRAFSASEFHSSLLEHSADAIILSGIADKVGKIEQNYWQQKYQIRRSDYECREFFKSELSNKQYPLNTIIGLFHDTTGHRVEACLSMSPMPFDVIGIDIEILGLLSRAGYASQPKNQFKWTDKMAAVFFEKGDWGASTVSGWAQKLRESNKNSMNRLIKSGLIEPSPDGIYKWTDKSNVPGEVFDEEDWINDISPGSL